MNKYILAAYKYEHLKFYNNILTLKTLIWGIYGGLVLGLAVSYYHKFFIGGFVRRLLKKEALGEEKALSLSDLDLKGMPIIKLAVKRDSALKKYVRIANPEECISKKSAKPFVKRIRRFFNREKEKAVYDFDKARFYIPEELKYRADTVFEKKGSTPAAFVIFVVLLTALAAAVSFLIPELLTMLDNFIGIIVKDS